MSELNIMEMNMASGGEEGPIYDTGTIPASAVKELNTTQDLVDTVKSKDPDRYGNGPVCQGTTFQEYIDVGSKGPKIG